MAQAQEGSTMNQCDGCRQGNKPDDKGFHRDAGGRAYMVCQANKYPKGIIDLRRLAKKGGVSIEPGRKHWFVDDSEQCGSCGAQGYTERGLCEDCFIEQNMTEDEWEFENNA